MTVFGNNMLRELEALLNEDQMSGTPEKMAPRPDVGTELVVDTDSPAYKFLEEALHFKRKKLTKDMSQQQVREAMFGKQLNKR